MTQSKLTLHFQIGLPPWARRFFEVSGARWGLLMDPGDAPPLPELPHVNWIIRFYERMKAAVDKGISVKDIINLPVVEEVARMKLSPVDEAPKTCMEIEHHIEEQFEHLYASARRVTV